MCYAAREGTLWASLDHGHWRPKLSRSREGGATWEGVPSLKSPEGARPIVQYLPTPDFDPAAPAGQPEYRDATVLKIWTLAFGSADQPGRLYAGTIPGGLFVSDDGGDTSGSTAHCGTLKAGGDDLFAGEATSETRGGGTPTSIDYGVFEPGIHSIVVDPHAPPASARRGVVRRRAGNHRRRPDLGRAQSRPAE